MLLAGRRGQRQIAPRWRDPAFYGKEFRSGASWTTELDIASWLRGLGLERYEDAFRENRIGADILPSPTAEDLKELGITLVGDRRRPLDAIAALREGARPPFAAGTSSTTRVDLQPLYRR